MMTPERCPDCHTFLDARLAGGLCPRCLVEQATSPEAPAGGPLEPAGMRAQLAEALPGYEILECLGIGGMGAVYKARQARLDRLVAIKVLLTPPAEIEGWNERFEREARALARLSHKNIIGVHDFGQVGELSYLILEYVEGANLRQLMAAGRLTLDEALAIVPQVCDALGYAHGEGVVHRDVKPENILMDLTGHVKIADFGLAKIVDRPASLMTLTGSQQAMGTFRYMAPEQIDRPKEVDHRADIYALGTVIYEMLTGEVPVGRFELPSQLRPGLDPGLDEVVLKALERSPERRFESARELSSALAGARVAGPVAGQEEPASPSRPGRGAAAEPEATARTWYGRSSLRGLFSRILPPRDVNLFTPILCVMGMLICVTVRPIHGFFAFIGFCFPLLGLLVAGWDDSSEKFQRTRLLSSAVLMAIWLFFFKPGMNHGDGTEPAQGWMAFAIISLLGGASVLFYLLRLRVRLEQWSRPEGFHARLRWMALGLQVAILFALAFHETFGDQPTGEVRVLQGMIIASQLLGILIRSAIRPLGILRVEGGMSLLASLVALACTWAIAESHWAGNTTPVLVVVPAIPLAMIGLFELLAGSGRDELLAGTR